MQTSIHEIVREAEKNYVRGSTKQGKYIDWSMYDTVETIDAYLNSKHTSGLTDSLGREKPFFNIVTAATNIWYRATDIDRKNVKILPKNSKQVVSAFIATVILQDWMDKNRFGQFLNAWGRGLSRYGSAVVEFVEKDGELIASYIPWNRIIPDPVDFKAIPFIKKFYKTPAQLKNMATKGHPDYAGYDMDAVDNLIKSQSTRKTLEGIQQDNESHFIEIWEVHGELPTYFLDKDPQPPEDDKDLEFRQQMHVVSYIETKQDEYDDFTLFKGKEKINPAMITHLIEEDGRTLSIGAVEYLFDAQWMQNHTIKQWKDQLDLSSKLIFQTADTNFLGRNVLTAIETGDIMVHADNKPLTLLNNQGHDITSLQAFANQWKVLEREITNTPDATRGETMPSGTPYRLAAILQQEANSLFELMTENKGLALEDMLRTFVIPHLKKKIKGNKDEILAILDAHGIKQIDSMYIPNEAIKRYNKRTIKKVLEMQPGELMQGAVPSPYQANVEEESVRQELAPLGNQRFFKPDEMDQKTWDEIIDDDIWDNLKVEIVPENSDKNATLTTLSSMLQTFAQADPAFAKLIRDKIAIETGAVSPLELSTTPSQPNLSPPTGGEQALSAVKQQ